MSVSFSPGKRLPRFAAALSVLLLSGSPVARGADDTSDRFERMLELDGIQRIRVQNVNGAVHIESWDRPTLSLVALRTAKGTRADEAIRETEIRIRKSGDTLEIETILPKNAGWSFLFWWSRPSVDVSYELKLPPAVPVQAETVNGRILAERRAGPLVLNTVNGSIRVSGQEGPVRANTVNGSVEVSFN